MRTLSASAAAALLPNMPRLSMRMVDTPLAASASASRRYIPAVTPSGLLPSRSVGPEPGMMMAIGAFGPPSGAASVPCRVPEGPSMLSRVSAADTFAVALMTTASAVAASFMTSRLIPLFRLLQDYAARSGATTRTGYAFDPFRVSAKVRYLTPKASALVAVHLDGRNEHAGPSSGHCDRPHRRCGDLIDVDG